MTQDLKAYRERKEILEALWLSEDDMERIYQTLGKAGKDRADPIELDAGFPIDLENDLFGGEVAKEPHDDGIGGEKDQKSKHSKRSFLDNMKFGACRVELPRERGRGDDRPARPQTGHHCRLFPTARKIPLSAFLTWGDHERDLPGATVA